MPEQTLIQKALDIIERTSDGDDLSPEHLKLTEMAVNGFLNEKGIEIFGELHKQVMEGSYKKPYLHGVEFMTQDHEGYIYFKDRDIEHFSRPWAYSLEAKDYLERLQSRCLFLEKNGLEISFSNTQKMPQEYFNGMIQNLNELANGNGIVFSHVQSNNDCTRNCSYLLPGVPDSSTVWNNAYEKDFIENNSDRDICDGIFNAKVDTYVYGDGERRSATPDELKQLNLVFDYLTEHSLVSCLGSQAYQHNLYPEVEEDDDEDLEM